MEETISISKFVKLNAKQLRKLNKILIIRSNRIAVNEGPIAVLIPYGKFIEMQAAITRLNNADNQKLI